MEYTGKQIWRRLRTAVEKAGSLRVLHDIAKNADYAASGALETLINEGHATWLLTILGAPAVPSDEGYEYLHGFMTTRRRLTPARQKAADTAAMRILDLWAGQGDNPGAEVAGYAAEVIGERVGRLVFDSGVPGSAQVTNAWLLDESIVQSNSDIGAFAVNRDLLSVLSEWLDYADAEIVIDLSATQLRSVRRRRASEQRGIEYQVRLNGVERTVTAAGRLVEEGEPEEHQVSRRRRTSPPEPSQETAVDRASTAAWLDSAR